MKLYIVIAAIISIFLTYIIWDFYRLKTINKEIKQETAKKLNSTQKVLPAADIRKRNDSNPSLVYDYLKKFNSNYLIINLSKPSEICFKAYLNFDKENANSDKPTFTTDSLVNFLKNGDALLGGQKPRALFNTAYFTKGKNSPLDTNAIQGRDYTTARDWTSMDISKDNKVRFVRRPADNLYNAAGGGPKIITDSKFEDPCTTQALTGKLCLEVESPGEEKSIYNQQRTMVGITDKNYMIVVVSEFLEHQDLQNVFTEITAKENVGTVTDANMFDGGNSSALLFDDNNDQNFDAEDIKQSGSPVVASMLVFTGDVCKLR